MQIQRIQTLWLILALGCMVAFIVLPFATLDIPGTGMAEMYPYTFYGLIIPAGLAALFMLLAVFGYKNLKAQRSEIVLALMMTLVAVGITAYLIFDRASVGVIEWRWTVVFPVAALVFTILAIAGVNRDMKLLRSYDRLR